MCAALLASCSSSSHLFPRLHLFLTARHVLQVSRRSAAATEEHLCSDSGKPPRLALSRNIRLCLPSTYFRYSPKFCWDSGKPPHLVLSLHTGTFLSDSSFPCIGLSWSPKCWIKRIRGVGVNIGEDTVASQRQLPVKKPRIRTSKHGAKLGVS